jgi:MSHA biogenesis protein MshP
MITPHSQRGFSLVAAMFLMVVLASLGAFMISLSGTQHFTALYALQGAKAYQAARAGVEWGISSAISAVACPAATTLNTFNGSLAGFQATVSCASSSHTENGATFNVYTISATGETISPTFGSPGYALRRISSTITDAP